MRNTMKKNLYCLEGERMRVEFPVYEKNNYYFQTSLLSIGKIGRQKNGRFLLPSARRFLNYYTDDSGSHTMDFAVNRVH